MNWIDVNERLPEVDEKVIVCTQTKKGVKSINLAYIDKDGWWHGMGSMSGVIAWMPLPEVYDTRESEMKNRLERLKTIRSDLQDVNLYIVDDDGMWPWPEGDEIVPELLDAEIKRISDNDAVIKEAFRKIHESMEQSIELMKKSMLDVR